MSKKLLVGLCLFASVGAIAGDHHIELTGRMDYVYTQFNQNIEKKSDFEINYAKLHFSGPVNKTVTYSLLLNLTGAAGSTNRDSTLDYLEEISVTKNLADEFNISLGKMAVLSGGRESLYLDVDKYTNSMFADEVYRLGNRSGIILSKEVSGQVFGGQFFSATNSTQSYGYAVQYNGTILDGKIKPILSYTHDVTKTNTNGEDYLAAGLGLNFAPVKMDFDYGNKTIKSSQNTSSVTLTSLAFKLALHKSDIFIPFVKYIFDDNSKNVFNPATKPYFLSGKDAKKVHTISLGADIFEAKASPISYHVVFSGKENRLVTGGVKYKNYQGLVGVKFDTSIL